MDLSICLSKETIDKYFNGKIICSLFTLILEATAFTHGQLYVILSHIYDTNNIHSFLEPGEGQEFLFITAYSNKVLCY